MFIREAKGIYKGATSQMQITIGAPVRNREKTLPEYLDAIYKLDYPKELISLFFLVNDSIDKTEEILTKFHKDHASEYKSMVIMRKSLGAPPDRRASERRKVIYANLATLRNTILEYFLKYTEAQYFYSIDTDIIVNPESLKKMISINQKIVSAMVYNDFSRGRLINAFDIKKNENGQIGYKRIEPKTVPDIFECEITGACYIIHRSVIMSGVRYGNHAAGEDMEFCIQAHEKGFKMFCIKNIAIHKMYNQGGYFEK